MNNKGFTLIEVIAIVSVLVGIFLVSFPALINVIKLDEEKQYNNMINDLCAAGKTYMYSNLDMYKELSIPGSEISIDVNALISYGSVNKDLNNPKTNLSVKDSVLQYTVLNDFTLKCDYID